MPQFVDYTKRLWYDERKNYGGNSMSVVIGVISKNNGWIISDGRVIKDGEIIDEDFRKWVQYNRNYYIGFTGNKEDCELVINVINELAPKNFKGIFDAAYWVVNEMKQSKRVCNVNLLICGKENGKAMAVAFNQEQINKLVYCPAMVDDDGCKTFVLAPTAQLSKKLTAKVQESIINNEDMRRILFECVDFAAENDNSINTKKFYKEF